jgi:vancomycin resistance protein VanJ
VYPDSAPSGGSEPGARSTHPEEPPDTAPRKRLGARIFAFGYPAATLVLWALTRGVAERTWLTTLLLYGPPPAYLALGVPFLLLAAVTRDRSILRSTILGGVLTATLLMDLVIPLPRFASGSFQPRVRVLAYNIEGARAGFGGLRNHLTRFDPDVVVLSEANRWGSYIPMGPELGTLLPGWTWVQGGDVIVASRWPFAQTHRERLGLTVATDPSSRRQKVRALIRAPFGRFNVVGVHFRTDYLGRSLTREWRRPAPYLRQTAQVRLEQAQDLMRWIRPLQDPTIVAGDFNTPPAGMAYGQLVPPLRSAFSDAGGGWGFTFPARLPMLRIDHILYSAGLEARRCQVGAPPGSDHRPLFAELAFTR